MAWRIRSRTSPSYSCVRPNTAKRIIRTIKTESQSSSRTLLAPCPLIDSNSSNAPLPSSTLRPNASLLAPGFLTLLWPDRYQTIQMCHACAQAINIVAMKQAQPESPPPRKASLTQPKNESNVPLENANAHELFWAKADREEVRRGRQQPAKTDYRPSSAKEVRILFRSTRLKKLKPALPSNQDTPNHTLPRIADSTDTIIAHNYEGSEFVVKMARHLQRRYGRPSTRYALAQCGIFPQGPSVAIRTLEALGTDSAVLAGVAAHVSLSVWLLSFPAFGAKGDFSGCSGLL